MSLNIHYLSLFPSLNNNNNNDDDADSVNNLNVISDNRIPIRVNAKGKVFWNPPGIYQTQCDITITFYPFDTQYCKIILKSVGYTLREMNLTVLSTGVETSSYEKNGEWDLLSTSAYRLEVNDVNDKETYPSIAVTFTLKRRPLYYGLNIILPTFVLSMLSVVVFSLAGGFRGKDGLFSDRSAVHHRLLDHRVRLHAHHVTEHVNHG